MAAPARNTPSAVARQLRQEAGFGCCVCGFPIFQYHHIIEWSEEQHFRPADMMVLCPNHHDMASKRVLSEAEQREFKSRPYNIQNNRAQGLLKVKQDYCAASLGTVMVVGEGTFLSIDKEDIFGLHIGEGNLEISLRLFSESDDLLLEIDRNEWISGDPMPWDIEADYQFLTLRERARKISISLDAKKIPLEVRAEFWKSGKAFVLDKNGISISGNSVTAGGGFRELALVGMVIDLQSDKLTFGPRPENPHAELVWGPDVRDRLWRARNKWRNIKAARSKVDG